MKFLLTHQQTERLLFRKLEPGDFEEWLELFNDENTARMLGMEHFKTPAERCEKWFEWTFYRYENNLGGQNVLISKADHQLIGQCGLLVREVEEATELEIAYSILPLFRGKGLPWKLPENAGTSLLKTSSTTGWFPSSFLKTTIPEK